MNLKLILFSIVHICSTTAIRAANELKTWSENRLIECIFCMDYDDYQHLSIFGCDGKKAPAKCKGNTCYMRQHKKLGYFLYTSGCLNLTQLQFDRIKAETSKVQPERGAKGGETQLCEVTKTINTCMCSNRASCNRVSSTEPFTEYSSSLIFGNTNFDEIAHFRFFLPNDPILTPIQQNSHGEKYYIIPKAVPTTSAASDSLVAYTRTCSLFVSLMTNALFILMW
ncbi:hypothetical protein Ddc_05576 [Ditylenchus destructor]|nr:hypothetical protein Ddc_05576 [Ditylenchus destructor]